MLDTREERGKEIAEGGNVKKVTDHSFKVKSQSGKGVYEVKATPNGMTCTCPDFVYCGGKIIVGILWYSVLARKATYLLGLLELVLNAKHAASFLRYRAPLFLLRPVILEKIY
jgi:hypothetical protein